MMKKMIALMMTVMMLLSVSVVFAFAQDVDQAETASGTPVYVTIADKDGKLAVAAEKIDVTDVDGDSALTINDVLYTAHEQFYEGGAAAGYATEMTKYGLSLTKLWGTVNGYNYGYMVNNVSAWSMTDPVKEDDYVAAYVLTDLKNFTDRYAYFDQLIVEPDCAAQVTLQLSKIEYDDQYQPVVQTVEGAVLTVDGEPTEITTDADGKATLFFEENGEYLVSAAAEGQTLVPPVCLITVSCYEEATPDEADNDVPLETVKTADDPTAAPTVAATVAPTAPATNDSATKDSSTATSSTPKTGDETHLWLWVLIAGLCLCGIVGVVVIYRKFYAKK